MVTVTQMKCACPSCVCIIDVASAMKKDGKIYCSDSCANGHPNGFGCGHEGCGCKN